MTTNYVKPHHFIARDGKLLPRPTTPPNTRKNYRYIPHEPLNSPGPEDYFRETIYRLQKENAHLKNQLKGHMAHQCSQQQQPASQPNKHQLEISQLHGQISKLQREVQNKSAIANHKDKQVLELSNQNTRLHLRVENILKQLQTLHGILMIKDEEIESKNLAIRNYCRTIQDLAKKDQEEQKTNFSEHYFSTPKIDEQEEEYEDENEDFYSLECKTFNDRSSFQNRMYMTPDNHSFKSFEDPVFYYRSEEIQRYPQEHEWIDEHQIKPSTHVKTLNEEDNIYMPREEDPRRLRTEKAEEDNESRNLSDSRSSSSELSENLKTWSEWANQNQNFLTLDIMEDKVDPIAGGFLSLLRRQK